MQVFHEKNVKAGQFTLSLMAHRGEIIENFIRKHDITLTGLAKKVPFTARTMYRHFDNPDLELEKILEYSKALNHDFSDVIPEMSLFKFQLGEPESVYNNQPTTPQAQAEYYRGKYEHLLEKYNELQEQYIKMLRSSGNLSS